MRSSRFPVLFLLAWLAVVASPARALPREATEPVFRSLRAGVTKALGVASRGDRIQLGLEFAYHDPRDRILLDVRGSLRVKVPAEKLRGRLATMLEQGRSFRLSSDGPISLDLALSPLSLEQDELTLGVQLDLIVLLPRLVEELAKAGAAVLGGIAVGALLKELTVFLVQVRAEVLGDAVRLAAGELGGFVSHETGGVAVRGVAARGAVLEQLVREGSSKGLRRNLAVALIRAFAGAAGLGAVTTLGATLGLSLLPAGLPITGAFLATAGATWFGGLVAEMVAVKLPIKWKLSKLRRLYEKLAEAEGEAADQARSRFEAHQSHLAELLRSELEDSSRRPVFFELFLATLKKDFEQRGGVALAPFEGLFEAAYLHLQSRLLHQQDWMAARKQLQLLAAVGRTPQSWSPSSHQPPPSRSR